MSKWWTTQEELIVKSFLLNPEEDTVVSIAKALGRTPGAIRQRIKILREQDPELAALKQERRLFEDWEIKYLEENHMEESMNSMAEKLGRRPATIRTKLVSLGLRR